MFGNTYAMKNLEPTADYVSSVPVGDRRLTNTPQPKIATEAAQGTRAGPPERAECFHKPFSKVREAYIIDAQITCRHVLIVLSAQYDVINHAPSTSHVIPCT